MKSWPIYLIIISTGDPYFLSDVDGDREYEGPWQDFTRDIDPSWTRAFSADATTNHAKGPLMVEKAVVPNLGEQP